VEEVGVALVYKHPVEEADCFAHKLGRNTIGQSGIRLLPGLLISGSLFS